MMGMRTAARRNAAHVANGDMVTLALLQGVLNTFVIVLAREDESDIAFFRTTRVA